MLSSCYFNYQPRYYNGKISSYEALLRTPKSDIECYIESINDHVAFDLAVIESIIQQRSRLSNPEKTKLAINISISSLLNDEFIDACEKIFEHEKNIILELTRHDTTSDFSRIQSAIKQLKAKDIQFALDDYGKGYANSELFLHLDVEYIKLDRKLIKNITQSYVVYSLIKTKYEKIVKVLDKHIIIEGVETFEQLNLLKQFGAMTYQGFYFSKPISIEDVKQTASNIDSYKNKTKSFCNLLDQAIYDMNRAKDHHEIKRAIQHLMKIDHYNTIGISPNFFDVYNEQRRINKNYNELLERKSSPHFLLVSSLISSCDALVIIRDSEGNAIFNNDKHINYLGVDLVDYSAEQACNKFPDYHTCLDLDNELLNSDTCFIVSNETVETENGKQFFHTYRQKIKHFDQAFIICSIYEANDSINIDTLTGCYQKSYLKSTYASAYQTLVFIDLDGFKLINDVHGHNKGDEVLRDFAQSIQKMLRERDVIVRFGGDEFVLLLDSSSLSGVRQRIEIIRDKIEAYFLLKQLYLSFSYGIVTVGDCIENALNKADEAMYKQKYARKI
ncbi:GGDEF domain-containing protein [Photobacterium piscicola]|uniref:GGDEF domain-containing protein n=1 Tax=Photobacterium piscicola TaxID=1378299 RepID=A0ABU6LG07_9GAMM|nr:GGDEF domain-containing protein [Photobacterium piscicola]MEC6908145.1 GGDEF domain-containing protein [Photobacterium piscicola]